MSRPDTTKTSQEQLQHILTNSRETVALQLGLVQDWSGKKEYAGSFSAITSPMQRAVRAVTDLADPDLTEQLKGLHTRKSDQSTNLLKAFIRMHPKPLGENQVFREAITENCIHDDGEIAAYLLSLSGPATSTAFGDYATGISEAEMQASLPAIARKYPALAAKIILHKKNYAEHVDSIIEACKVSTELADILTKNSDFMRRCATYYLEESEGFTYPGTPRWQELLNQEGGQNHLSKALAKTSSKMHLLNTTLTTVFTNPGYEFSNENIRSDLASGYFVKKRLRKYPDTKVTLTGLLAKDLPENAISAVQGFYDHDINDKVLSTEIIGHAKADSLGETFGNVMDLLARDENLYRTSEFRYFVGKTFNKKLLKSPYVGRCKAWQRESHEIARMMLVYGTGVCYTENARERNTKLNNTVVSQLLKQRAQWVTQAGSMRYKREKFRVTDKLKAHEWLAMIAANVSVVIDAIDTPINDRSLEQQYIVGKFASLQGALEARVAKIQTGDASATTPEDQALSDLLETIYQGINNPNVTEKERAGLSRAERFIEETLDGNALNADQNKTILREFYTQPVVDESFAAIGRGAPAAPAAAPAAAPDDDADAESEDSFAAQGTGLAAGTAAGAPPLDDDSNDDSFAAIGRGNGHNLSFRVIKGADGAGTISIESPQKGRTTPITATLTDDNLERFKTPGRGSVHRWAGAVGFFTLQDDPEDKPLSKIMDIMRPTR